MWDYVAASVAGTSHEELGTPCQDGHAVLRHSSSIGELLLIALADGAGTATHSHIGSNEVANHLLATAAKSIPELSEITKEHVTEWLQEVLRHLDKVSERESVPLRQLACTMLFAIAWKGGAILAQIGDGAWVLERDNEIVACTWPERGEYANVTTFLTSDGALDNMQFVRIEAPFAAIAGFTDGIQSVALEYSDRKPHAPFFKPLFEVIRSSTEATELIAPLQRFLSSPEINRRTDDDKTLVLASWREP